MNASRSVVVAKIPRSVTKGALRQFAEDEGCQDIVGIKQLDSNATTYSVLMMFESERAATYAFNTMSDSQYQVSRPKSPPAARLHRTAADSSHKSECEEFKFNDTYLEPKINALSRAPRASQPSHSNSAANTAASRNHCKTATTGTTAANDANTPNTPSASVSNALETTCNAESADMTDDGFEEFLCDNTECYQFHPKQELIVSSRECGHKMTSNCLVPCMLQALVKRRLPTCPAHHCNAPVSEQTAHQLLDGSAVQTFQKLEANFVCASGRHALQRKNASVDGNDNALATQAQSGSYATNIANITNIANKANVAVSPKNTPHQPPLRAMSGNHEIYAKNRKNAVLDDVDAGAGEGMEWKEFECEQQNGVPMQCVGCLQEHDIMLGGDGKWRDCATQHEIFSFPGCNHQYRRQCLKRFLHARINSVHRDYCSMAAMEGKLDVAYDFQAVPEFGEIFKCKYHSCRSYLTQQDTDRIVSQLFENQRQKGANTFASDFKENAGNKENYHSDDEVGLELDKQALGKYREYKTLLLLKQEGCNGANVAHLGVPQGWADMQAIQEMQTMQAMDAIGTFECVICATMHSREQVFFGNERVCELNEKCSVCRGCARQMCESDLMGSGDVPPKWPKCCNTDCKEPFEEVAVRNLFTDEEYEKLYQRWAKQNIESKIVGSSDDIKYCPNPKCNNIAALAPGAENLFDCNLCGHTYCLACANLELKSRDEVTRHNCQAYRRGKDVNALDREMNNYAARRGVKRCPGCRAGVEKTLGCDHMTCRCGTHWCWKCEGRMDPSRLSSHRCSTRTRANTAVMPPWQRHQAQQQQSQQRYANSRIAQAIFPTTTRDNRSIRNDARFTYGDVLKFLISADRAAQRRG